MQGYEFSERVRHVLNNSVEAARARRHEYVGTEHLLLGVLAEQDGVASDALNALAVDRVALAAQIDGAIGTGSSRPPDDGSFSYTTRAKNVLELTMAAARELHHTYVGVEHLLLGLVREGSGIAAQLLIRAGVTDDAVRAETRRLLGQTQEPHVHDTDSERARTIIGMEREALERWGRGDPSGFLEISAPDVVYFDPFQPRRLNGIDELRALYESIRGQVSIAHFELIDPRVQSVGDVAVLTFNYVAVDTSEATSRWNCTEVFRHQAGMWRIIQTHWSFTEPNGTTS